MAGVTSGAVPGPRWSDGSAMDPSFILGMTLQRPSTSLLYRHKVGPSAVIRFLSSFVRIIAVGQDWISRLGSLFLSSRIIGRECEAARLYRCLLAERAALDSSVSIKRDVAFDKYFPRGAVPLVVRETAICLPLCVYVSIFFSFDCI